MELHLNPKFALEAQEDHLKGLEYMFSTYKVMGFRRGCMQEVEKAERFYPNHSTTLKMRAEFDQLKEKP